MLKKEELDTFIDTISKEIRILINENKDFKFYIGATGQKPVNEAYRWLTVRGKPKKVLEDGTIIQGSSKCVNRPVLVKKNDDNFRMKEAANLFPFKVLYESGHPYNVLKVEEQLQYRFNHLNLGTQRLWRHVAKSGKLKEDSDCYCCFMTFSTKTLDEMGLKINR